MPDSFVYLLNDLNLNSKIIPSKSVGIIRNEMPDYMEVQFINPNVSARVKKNKIASFDPTKTGDDYNEKVCNICHLLLPVEQFAKNQNAKNNRTVRRPSCKSCRVDIDGKSMSTTEKKEWNKTKPYLEIFECPVCHKRTIAGLTSKVVLDHNHEDGSGRGWICDSCNTGLGRFKDDVALLENAILHLKKKV